MSDLTQPEAQSTAASKELFPSIDAANAYVEEIRENYRDGVGSYRGNRSDEQKFIAEYASDQARQLVDGVYLGMLSLSLANNRNESVKQLDKHSDDKIIADKSWNDFRYEFTKLFTGFSVLTNRIHNEVSEIPEYADMTESDQMKVASVLFSDFLKHNALRFGIDTAGIKSTKRSSKHTEDGEIEHVVTVVDRDKALSLRDIAKNMKARDYRAGEAQHQAGKISPALYIELRKQYPELDKDKFDQMVSHFTDVKAALENQE